MRLTDAEREQMFEALSSHAAAGSLTIDELERRVAIVADAVTREDAAAAFTGLPALASDRPAPVESRPRIGRGHGESDRADAGWQPTDERFRDPTSRRVMRVWIDPATGARHYVADE